MLGLYVHIPFCRHLCNYCDFYKMVVSEQFQTKYLGYLLKDLYQNSDYEFQTIYLGGGTPSSLSSKNLQLLLESFEQKFSNLELLEYTIELNPEDISLELINILKKTRINRLSIGIQTFNERLQGIIGRHCSYSDIQKKITMLKENGYNNINLDLMYGIGNETISELIEDIEKILSLQPTHISTYSLILEERTILYHQAQMGGYKTMDEDIESLMYDNIIKILKDHHYIHYEISNFSLPTYESKHNLIYWSNGEYIGIGAGASGYYQKYRYKVTTSLSKYYESLDQNNRCLEENEYIEKNVEMWEEVMLGLRKVQGFSLRHFYEKFHCSVESAFPNIFGLLDDGFLEIVTGNLRIKENNLYISNAILTKIM